LRYKGPRVRKPLEVNNVSEAVTQIVATSQTFELVEEQQFYIPMTGPAARLGARSSTTTRSSCLTVMATSARLPADPTGCSTPIPLSREIGAGP